MNSKLSTHFMFFLSDILLSSSFNYLKLVVIHLSMIYSWPLNSMEIWIPSPSFAVKNPSRTLHLALCILDSAAADSTNLRLCSSTVICIDWEQICVSADSCSSNPCCSRGHSVCMCVYLKLWESRENITNDINFAVMISLLPCSLQHYWNSQDMEKSFY